MQRVPVNRAVEGVKFDVGSFYLSIWQQTLAEWLRRLTRNQIPSGSVGSNPAVCDVFLL